MIEFYYAPTANGRRAAFMLEECGLPYTAHKVDIEKKERPAELLKLNPKGSTPVILDTDAAGGKPVAVVQSAAILLYLAEKSGKLMPKDAAGRAAAYQWTMQAVTDIAPMSSAMNYAPDARAIFEKLLLGNAAVVDARLGEAPYLAGNEVSIADLALLPVMIRQAPLLEKAPGLDNLKRWIGKMKERPAIQKAMKL